MALPNPALTFEQSAIISAASTSTADVLLAIQGAFADLSVNVWTTVRGNEAAGGANPAIRIIAPSSSPISNFNAIIGAPTVTGSFTKASYRDHTAAYTGDSATQDGHLWLAIGPDGYDAGTAPADWLTAGDAFGTGKRESGFWVATDISGSGASAVTKVWVVASEETCAICFRYASDSNCGFLYFGAIVEGVNAANVEHDDRLYGMCTAGSTSLTPMSNFWHIYRGLDKDQCLSHEWLVNAAHSGLFDPSTTDAATFPATMSSRGDHQLYQRITSTLTFDGGLALAPIQSWRSQHNTGHATGSGSANGFCGRFRGIYYTPYGTARSVLLDSEAAVKGYRMSGSLVTAQSDGIIFGNG